VTALNAETGAVEWVRYTIPGPGEDGHDTWSGDVQGLRGVDRRAQHRRGGDARHITVARRHAILHGHGTPHGLHGARKFEQKAVASRIGDTAMIFDEEWFYQFGAVAALGRKSGFFVNTDKA